MFISFPAVDLLNLVLSIGLKHDQDKSNNVMGRNVQEGRNTKNVPELKILRTSPNLRFIPDERAMWKFLGDVPSRVTMQRISYKTRPLRWGKRSEQT